MTAGERHDWRTHASGPHVHRGDRIEWLRAAPLASETTDAGLRAAVSDVVARMERNELSGRNAMLTLRAALSSSGSIDAERLAGNVGFVQDGDRWRVVNGGPEFDGRTFPTVDRAIDAVERW